MVRDLMQKIRVLFGHIISGRKTPLTQSLTGSEHVGRGIDGVGLSRPFVGGECGAGTSTRLVKWLEASWG